MSDNVKQNTAMMGDYSGNNWQRFLDAESADQGDRQRALNNLRLYLPTTAWDSFPGDVQRQFREEGRSPQKYNLITMYVDGLAGNLITANSVDPKFVDSEADDIDTTDTLQALQNVYYSDKNLFNYDKERNASVLNGCIYRGVEEIKIIRTIHNPLGRIGFESLSPTTVIFDPSAVLKDDIGAESKEAWKRFYMYPVEIMKAFPEAKEQVTGYLQQQSNFSESRSFTHVPEEIFWQNKYMVIEWFHTVTEKIEVAFDSENMIELPNNKRYEFGSQEDFNFKKEFIEKGGRKLSPGAITVRTKRIDALYVTTFSPGLNVVLQEKKDERQIYKADGNIRLPFYTFAYTQKNGKTAGAIDLIKDAQEDLNKREAARTKYMTQTPFNKIIIHPEAYGEDQAKKDDLTRNLNDPSKPFYLDAHAPLGVPLITGISGIQENPAFLQDEQWKISLMDRMSGFNPAMQGREGKSGESGLLFSRKVIEGNTLAHVRNSNLLNYELGKSEAWFQLAIKLYGGETEDERTVNTNRKFMDEGGNKTVLNEIKGHDAFNNPIVVNDLSKINRGFVIIAQSKESDYKKQADREINVSLSQAMGPDTPYNVGYKTVLNAALVRSVDDLSPKQKEDIDEMAEMSIEVAKKQLQLQSSQLDQQIQQFQGGGQQGIPGLPQEGGQAPEQGGLPPELLTGAPPTQGQQAQVAA